MDPMGYGMVQAWLILVDLPLIVRGSIIINPVYIFFLGIKRTPSVG